MSNELQVISEDDMIYTLQTSLYVGAKEESVRMVMAYCKAAKLDVMQKPVHIVPMWSAKQQCMTDVVMPGIGLYRTQASRTGEFAGITEPEFGQMITETIGGQQVTFPEYAKCTVKRALPSGVIAEFTSIEYWMENYAIKGGQQKSQAPNAMWYKRPRGQIAKCAEAQALRKAFPELGSAPTAEEMEGKTLYQEEKDITPEPKPIVKKPLSDKRIDDAITAIKNGEFTLDQILDSHELTPEQLQKFNDELRTLENGDVPYTPE